MHEEKRTSPRRAFAVVALTALCAAVAAGSRTTPQPPAWQTVSAVAFPDVARAAIDDGVTEDDVRTWTAALADSSPETRTRAAVLLGAALAAAGDHAAAAERALLAHLESRTSAGSRFAVGPELVAARALDERARADESVRSVLAELAAGPSPHPDLAVRVECGAVAISAGPRDDLTAFLLAVLRAETPDQTKSPRTWERIKTLAWVKTRAAEALSLAANVPLQFRPDGSWAHQMREADRLEELLGAR